MKEPNDAILEYGSHGDRGGGPVTFEIRTLADGELIQDPGFYNISLDRHHSQPCLGPSVTSGVLRKMELATPNDVWAFSKLNPDRWEQDDKTALRLGRAMAAYVEGGMDEVSKHFLLLPEDKPRKPTPAQIEAYNAGRITPANEASVTFWKKVDADPRDPISNADLKMIRDMGKVLAADPAASAVMGGIPEITMAWRDEQTGLWVLARPDTISFDGSCSDYKKINTQGNPFNYRLVDQRIEKHGYHQQMALASEGLERLGVGWPQSVGIVAQWDAQPHHVILREILEEDLRIGQFQNRRALDRFHECLTSNYWPGPGSDVGAYQMSDWMRKRMLEEMNVGYVAP